MKKLKIIYALFFITLLMLSTKTTIAQLTGLHAMYFENQYLANPAMAGIDEGLTLNATYQRQWMTAPGTPVLQNFTAEYQAGYNVGLGLLFNNDQAGLINKSRLMATFAYHIPINETGRLNFGLSAGVTNSHINYNNIVGDQGDLSVALFNNSKLLAVTPDGDVGASYTSDGFNMQVAIPNVGSTLFNTTGNTLGVDRPVSYLAASYIIPFTNDYNDGVTLEPKAAFRSVKGFDNIIDAGANVVIKEMLSVSAMYHSNKSSTLGGGFNLSPVRVVFSYTFNTGALGSYYNNTFELGIKYSSKAKRERDSTF